MKAYSVPGFTSEEELNILSDWATSVPKNGIIVEVGSLFGRSASAFADGADPSVTIYCIDFFDNIWPGDHIDLMKSASFEKDKVYYIGSEFKKYTSEYKNIIPLTNTQAVYPYDKEEIDLFFLDASHRNPNDIKNLIYFKKFFKRGTLICGHDYINDIFPDVVKNVHFLELAYNTKASFYERTSLWSIRITE